MNLKDSPEGEGFRPIVETLNGRNDIRDVATKYEAVCICLADARDGGIGDLVGGFPPTESVLGFGDFFQRLYEQYDRRFVYAAPGLATRTRRLEWDRQSTVLNDARIAEYAPRLKHDES